MKQYRPPAPVIHVEINSDGTYQVCEVTAGGTGTHTRLGPKWPKGRTVYQYAALMEERRRFPVSPLRVEAAPAGADSPLPLGSQSASAEAATA